jgi:LuxR family transcriptional regulator, quorum-sensing system regulator BjaR1
VLEVNDYGRNALDFIETIETLGTTDAVMDAMEKAFGCFGFETIILAGLPNPNQRFEQLVLAKRWPAEWFKIYTANNYIRDDPTVRLLRRSVYPFEWCEAPYDGAKEPRAAEIMRRAAECGMAKRICRSHPQPDGIRGLRVARRRQTFGPHQTKQARFAFDGNLRV